MYENLFHDENLNIFHSEFSIRLSYDIKHECLFNYYVKGRKIMFWQVKFGVWNRLKLIFHLTLK